MNNYPLSLIFISKINYVELAQSIVINLKPKIKTINFKQAWLIRPWKMAYIYISSFRISLALWWIWGHPNISLSIPDITIVIISYIQNNSLCLSTRWYRWQHYFWDIGFHCRKKEYIHCKLSYHIDHFIDIFCWGSAFGSTN